MILIVKYLAGCFAALLLLLLGLGIYYKDKTLLKTSIHTVVFLGIILITHSIIGFIVQEPRPFIAHTVHLLIPHAADSSFPSTHAMAMTAIALPIFATYKRLGSILLTGTIVTGFAKVFVGHHYPLDIIMGILITYLLFKISQNYISSIIDKMLHHPKYNIFRLLVNIKQCVQLIKKSKTPVTNQFNIRG
jgi:undecaprenyl-diphosphatase bcrC